jgi:hypothetical protein
MVAINSDTLFSHFHDHKIPVGFLTSLIGTTNGRLAIPFNFLGRKYLASVTEMCLNAVRPIYQMVKKV